MVRVKASYVSFVIKSATIGMEIIKDNFQQGWVAGQQLK
jgi:hypothetical protein